MAEEDKTVNMANLAKNGKVGVIIALVVLFATAVFPAVEERITSIAGRVVALVQVLKTPSPETSGFTPEPLPTKGLIQPAQ